MIAVEAKVIAPFFYNSFAVASGSSTLKDVISDVALNYAIANACGMLRSDLLPTKPDHKGDIQKMPHRCSPFVSSDAKLLQPQSRRKNADAEGGLPKRIAAGSSKGNVKDFYIIQEVAVGATYQGVIFNYDPFKVFGVSRLIVRVGRGRLGMLELKKIDQLPSEIRLNTHTGALFGSEIPTDRFYLQNIQLSEPMDINQANKVVSQWR